MLYTSALPNGTLELLKRLMAIPEIEDFNLAGGTALALHIGHRISFDLDFFGKRPFEREEILELVSHTGEVRLLHHTKNILVLSIEGVKVDFVNYKYDLLEAPQHREGLRLLSLPDIAAMKLNAISGRGKKRDFIDLFFLLKKFTLPEMMSFYTRKYPDGNEWLVVRSLGYFADADEDEDLHMFQKAEWITVKKTLETELRKHYG